jgi:uncharacterized protein (DUF169 family)
VEEKAATNWRDLSTALEGMLRLRTLPIGIKLFESEEEMMKVPRIRRLKDQATMCQVIYQARSIGWTLGVVADDFVGGNCATVIGLATPAPDLMDGTRLTGVWFNEKADAAKHQQAIPRIPAGKYNAAAFSPLGSGRLDPPDTVLIFGNPAQIILLINALQWKDYERYQFYCVGETACSDSITQSILADKPAAALPCYGERRYGHVADDEMVIAMPPRYLPKAIEGLQGLGKAGLKYPIPLWGAQADPSAGLAFSYPDQSKDKKKG